MVNGAVHQGDTNAYSNGCVCEYIACHILETIGLPVQETRLGHYEIKKGTAKTVVACKDFTDESLRLMENVARQGCGFQWSCWARDAATMRFAV
jgi:hypothetical protein